MEQIIKERLFKKKAEKALAMSLCELEKRKMGIQGESTIQQLEKTIIPELKEFMTNDLQNLPPKEERFLVSFANAFKAWEWGMRNSTKLYDLLEELYYEYKAF